MADSAVAGLTPSGALTGTELFYADNGATDTKVTADEIKDFVVDREVLSANRSYYVATTGNDSTGTGAVGAPWATLQHASDYISDHIDLNGKLVTINIATGTYVGVGMKGYYNSSIIYGHVYFVGDLVTPSNVVINDNAGGADPYPFSLGLPNHGNLQIYINGIRIVCTAGGFVSANPLYCGPKRSGVIWLGGPSGADANIECASNGANGGALFLGNIMDAGGTITIDGASLPAIQDLCFDNGDAGGTQGPFFGTYVITGTPTFNYLFSSFFSSTIFFGTISGAYIGSPLALSSQSLFVGTGSPYTVLGGTLPPNIGGACAYVDLVSHLTYTGLGADAIWREDTRKLVLGSSTLAGSVRLEKGGIEMKEITAPAAPASNEAVLFCQDNGSGKTQLAVRFPTGAIQVIATEP